MIKVGWRTNYNNKMDNVGFFHLGEVPDPKPPLSMMEGMLVELFTKDGSHPPVVKILFTLQTCRLSEVTDILALSSHGIPARQFIDDQLKNPDTTLEKLICIYFYCDPSVKLTSNFVTEPNEQQSKSILQD